MSFPLPYWVWFLPDSQAINASSVLGAFPIAAFLLEEEARNYRQDKQDWMNTVICDPTGQIGRAHV